MIEDIQALIINYARGKGAIYTELLESGIRFQIGSDFWEVIIKQARVPKNKNRINQ